MAEPKKKTGGRAVSDADVLPLEDEPDNTLPSTKGDMSFEEFMESVGYLSVGDLSEAQQKELEKEVNKKGTKKLITELERLMGPEKVKGGSVKKKAKGGSVKKYAKGGSVKKYARGGGVRAARF